MATNSFDYYAEKLAQGQDYQDYVAEKLYHEGIVLVNFQGQRKQYEHGENLLGLEIKFDDKFVRTNNLWIEVAEKRAASVATWTPSGIDRDDGTWLYGIGNRDEFFLFSKKTLQRYSKSVGCVIRENDRCTSRGFLLPRIRAAELAERCFSFTQPKR